jgi:hypothetical protein
MVSSFPLKKNAAATVVFPILDADGDLVTGAAGLDSEVSIDHGTFADCTNEATEIATSSGMYYLTLTAAETNGDAIAIIVKTSTANAKTTALVFYTAAQTLDETDAVVDSVKTEVDTHPTAAELWSYATRTLSDYSGVWSVATRALTDKAGFSLAADQSTVTVGTTNTITTWDKTGYALSAAGIDAIIDDVIEGTLTLRQAMRIMFSSLANKSSGGGTATLTFRDLADLKARITATCDADGNRTAVTVDGT